MCDSMAASASRTTYGVETATRAIAKTSLGTTLTSLSRNGLRPRRLFCRILWRPRRPLLRIDSGALVAGDLRTISKKRFEFLAAFYAFCVHTRARGNALVHRNDVTCRSRRKLPPAAALSSDPDPRMAPAPASRRRLPKLQAIRIRRSTLRVRVVSHCRPTCKTP